MTKASEIAGMLYWIACACYYVHPWYLTQRVLQIKRQNTFFAVPFRTTQEGIICLCHQITVEN